MGIKIGVFDSGVGGITVLTALRERLKAANFVYLGDTAHVPYGTKSPAQIEKLSTNCAKILKKKKVDVLVVACNTASSLALGAIQEVMGDIPVFGVVGPGIQAALEALDDAQTGQAGSHGSHGSHGNPLPILVLATRATVQSHAYGKALREVLAQQLEPGQDPPAVIEQACPLLVPMIEEGWIDHPILEQTIREYLRPHLERYSEGIALLGCTHYPWIHGVFEKVLPRWTVVNSAQAVADSLVKANLVQKRQKNASVKSSIEWIFTDPESVPAFARKWIER